MVNNFLKHCCIDKMINWVENKAQELEASQARAQKVLGSSADSGENTSRSLFLLSAYKLVMFGTLLRF